MSYNIKKGIITIIASFFLIFVDQFTKYLAALYLKGQEPFVMIPKIFQLRYLENRGSAFGMMQNRQIFLLVITIVFLALLIWFYFRIPQNKKYRPLEVIIAAVFSGAIGNMIDRIRLQYVIDFFYFELIDFPVFNIADIYITMSGIAFFLLFLFYYKEEDFDIIFPQRKKRGK